MHVTILEETRVPETQAAYVELLEVKLAGKVSLSWIQNIST